MQISEIGWVLIPLMIMFVFVRPQMLYVLMVFFIPFSATAILNFPGLGLQPFHFAAILLFLRVAVEYIVGVKKLRFSGKDKSLFLLAAFVVIVFLSLIMPFVIDGRLLVYSYDDKGWLPHVPSIKNITQFVYMVFGFFVVLLTIEFNRNMEQFRLTLRVLLWSALFVSVWGLIQVLLYYTDFAYPDFLFNNSNSAAAKNYGGVLEGVGLKRISSVAVEPSVCALYLLTIAPLVWYSVAQKKPIIGKFIDRIALLLIGATLVLSTSMTAYVGIVVIWAVIVPGFVKGLRKDQYFAALIVVGFPVLLLLIYLLSATAQNFVSTYVVGKLSTGSGMERMFLLKEAWGYFTEYPLLGIGWGSASSSDLVVGLLSNTGVLGFGAFVVFILYLFGKQIQIMAGYRQPLIKHIASGDIYVWSKGLSLSLFTLLLLNSIIGMSYVFGFFWFTIGLIVALTFVNEKIQFVALTFVNEKVQNSKKNDSDLGSVQ